MTKIISVDKYKRLLMCYEKNIILMLVMFI